MGNIYSNTGIFIIVFLGLFLSLTIGSAYASNSPENVVSDFAEAYFMLDKSMENYLCEKCKNNKDNESNVDLFLVDISKKAKERGFETNYMKSKLFDIKTKVINKTETSAQVQLTGKKIRSINPVFRIVVSLFSLCEINEVDEIINLVNEDGKWKIKGNVFDLSI